MALPAYRVQLTDQTTHQPVSDVDVLTNASAVTYENEKDIDLVKSAAALAILILQKDN